MTDYIHERENITKMMESKSYIDEFEASALNIFKFQYTYNSFYRTYIDIMDKKISKINSISDIPFLPIEFFKNKRITTGNWIHENYFVSSGTTSSLKSKHYIKSIQYYLDNAISGFKEFFEDPSVYCFIGILPGYIERSDSSLICMVNELIKRSKYQESGYYLNREEAMIQVLQKNKKLNIPTILIGVSFALLDLCKFEIDFPDLIVIETGGMKTSSMEMSKEEIIEKFKKSWKIKNINSEYGMTELLSQSYTIDGEWYKSASTKRVLIGQLSDPKAWEKPFKTGIVKVVDLSNFDTCSFIETQDLGISDGCGHFKIQGRIENSEIRGCNLLLENISS